jgi:hypothetical protein
MLTTRRAADVLKEVNNKDPNISGDEDENSDSEDAEFELELSDEEDNDNESDSIDVAINSVVERNYNELSEETRVMTAKDGTSWTIIKLPDVQIIQSKELIAQYHQHFLLYLTIQILRLLLDILLWSLKLIMIQLILIGYLF